MNVCGGAFCKTLAVHCKTIHFGSGILIKKRATESRFKAGFGVAWGK